MDKLILQDVDAYYTNKIKEFGHTPQGVDWNSAESQQMRFRQLLKIIGDTNETFSILDYGCGFGSMFEFMQGSYPAVSYTGFDISAAMIAGAQQQYGNKKVNWLSALPEGFKSDYVVASGIFNVKMEHSEAEWQQYIYDCLHKMNDISLKGFSFNVLTKYSDKEYMKDYLHYADPALLFDYCKREFSKYVSLLHDYPLYEFSILVRKNV